jgi:transcriptional regulator with XRE-family HTH domain
MRSGDVSYRLLGYIAWLKQELEKKKWNQNELAEASGQPALEITKAFRGELDVEVLRDIAKALGISFSTFFSKAIVPQDATTNKEVRRVARLLNSRLRRRREDGLRKLDELLKSPTG